jgi:uncharacterized membrane protein
MKLLFLVTAVALVAAPQFALADGDGTVTGVVGGAVAGAVVGGPVGAVVGGVAGGVIGNSVSGPGQPMVVVQPGSPCTSSRTRTANRDGTGSTTDRTDCPD